MSYEKYQRVDFNSAGAKLYANLYYPSKTLTFQEKRPLIIYCHGIGSKRDFDLRVPLEFSKRGFYVAALDYQGHGESGGNINNIDEATNTPALAQDCSKLLDKLRTMPFYDDVNDSQIGLLGHSLGGMVVLMNQALDPDFKVTVAWAPLVNFTPPRFGLEWTGYEQYIPVNLLNQTNTENLLIIMHVKDEVLDFNENAIRAKELTNCTVLNITKPLIGGGHQLFSDKVLIESINWFELHFFNSEVINGPIHITFIWNYVIIFINLFLLIFIVFTLISYTSRFFRLDSKQDTTDMLKEDFLLSKTEKMKKVVKIIVYSGIFIINWQLFASIFGLIGIFYASITFIILFISIKIIIYLQKLKQERLKFSIKQLKDLIKRELEIKVIVYTTVCVWYFIGIYLIFSYYYPFAFMWPSNIYSIVLSIAIFPIYLSIELLFRKILYPQLSFLKSEKTKARIIIISAIIIYLNLMILARSFTYLPSVLFTFIALLIVTIINTIIYEHTKRFSAVLIASFDIIQLFFSAVISNVIGVGAISHLF